MKNIKLICDTISDLPTGVKEKYDIEVIPNLIVFEDKEYLSGVDIDTDEFYEKMENSKRIPSTSQIPYVVYKEVFEKYINEGKDILYMVGSSAASGTHQAARMAIEEIEGNVKMIDTYSLSIGGGMLVCEAARMISEGKSIEEIINIIEEKKKDVVVFFSVNSLEHLHKGGRISGTKAAIGSILNINPILTVEDGLVKQKSQARGENKVISELIKQLKQGVNDDFIDKDIYVGYGADRKQVDKLIKKIEEELCPKSIQEFRVGPCVGCHAGPSIIAIGSLK